jgi:hypothetical protein
MEIIPIIGNIGIIAQVDAPTGTRVHGMLVSVFAFILLLRSHIYI